MSESGFELTPEADFDAVQAKFSGSLLWLVLRATENDDLDYQSIPPEVTCPFDNSISPEIKRLVRYPVIEFLCDGLVYFIVLNRILKRSSPITSFPEIVLSLKDYISAVNEENKPLSPDALRSKTDFDLDSHLMLTDALLCSYAHQTVSPDDISLAVRSINGNSRPTLPQINGIEEGIILWLNCLGNGYNSRLVASSQDKQNGSLLTSNNLAASGNHFPSISSLPADLKDGKALLSILLYYCRDSITIDCVKLTTPPSFEDCVHNIQIFRELCAEHVCTSIFALKTEDLVYAPQCLKHITLALLCEIFQTIEIEKRADVLPTYESLLHAQQNDKPMDDSVALPPTLSPQDADNDANTGLNSYPLLSKRSKKTPTAVHSKSVNAPVLLEDFDLKRTHLLASTVDSTVVNRAQSTEAWPPSRDQDSASTKPRLISLDFHPTKSQPLVSGTLSASSDKKSATRANQIDSLVEDTAVEDTPHVDASLLKSINMVPTITDESQFRAANDVLSSRNKNNNRRQWDHQEEVVQPQFEEDDIYGFSFSGSNASVDSVNFSDATSKVTDSLVLNSIPTSSQDDDGLSTITETSEPTSPSLYSFESTQTTSEISDTTTSHDAILSSVTMSRDFGYSLTSLGPRPCEENEEDDQLMRGSFITPDRHTVESAKAAGLPIIPTEARRGDDFYQSTEKQTAEDSTSELTSSANSKAFQGQLPNGDNYERHSEPSDITSDNLNEQTDNPSVMTNTETMKDGDDIDGHDASLVDLISSNDAAPIDRSGSSTPRQNLKWSYLEVDISKDSDADSNCSHDDEPAHCDAPRYRSKGAQQHHNLTTWFELSLKANDSQDLSNCNSMTDVHRLSPSGDSSTTWAEIMKKASIIDEQGGGEDKNRQPLTARLKMLKMKLEERRKHIESEKKKMESQWNDEMAKIGQTAFWFAIGNEKNECNGDTEESHSPASADTGSVSSTPSKSLTSSKMDVKGKSPAWEVSLDSTMDSDDRQLGRPSTAPTKSKKSPSGLMFVSLNDDNKKGNNDLHLDDFSKQRLRSPPMECSTPLRASQSKYSYGDSKTTDGMGNSSTSLPTDDISANNIGSSTPFVSSELSSAPEVSSPSSSEAPAEAIALHSHSSMEEDEPMKCQSAEEPLLLSQADKHHTVAQNDIDSNDSIIEQHHERKLWTDHGDSLPIPLLPKVTSSFIPEPSLSVEEVEEVVVEKHADLTEDDVAEIVLHDDPVVTEPGEDLSSDVISSCHDISPSNDSMLLSSVANNHANSEVTFLHNEKEAPAQHHQETLPKPILDSVTKATGKTSDIKSSPESMLGNTPQDNAALKSTSLQKSHVENAIVNQAENPGVEVSPSAKGMALFIGESEAADLGLTPEQIKKRDRFMKNRQKRQEEEKAKREAENERKARRETKKKERKANVGKGASKSQSTSEDSSLSRIPPTHDPFVSKQEDDLVSFHPVTQRPFSQPVTTKPFQTTTSLAQRLSDDLSSAQAVPQSQFSEYKGPSAYVRPSGKSNRKIMNNAIAHCCLSGEVNRPAKEKCLHELSQSQANHFLVLFRDGLKFRSLYSYAPDTEQVTKLYGIGPKLIASKMVEKLYKYNSGSKEFSLISAKSLSIQVDGMTIKKEYWQSNKTLSSKTDSNIRKNSASSKRN